MIQNHQDSITTLPPGAVHLATSDACRVQAFRVGAAAWGVQFHPEAAAARLDDVGRVASSQPTGSTGPSWSPRRRPMPPLNTDQARALVGAFAAVVREACR